MSFQLPPALSAEFGRELQSACLAGGFDSAPGPTRVRVKAARMTTERPTDESGFLITPWDIPDIGRLMMSTATLIERDEPYSLAVELARGKVNQLRNHLADWQNDGIDAPAPMHAELRTLCCEFGRLLAHAPGPETDALAQRVLSQAFACADRLMPQLAAEALYGRRKLGPLPATLACGMTALPADPSMLPEVVNALRLGLTWRAIEPVESKYDWSATDAVLDWAEASGLPVTIGPLIDFSAAGIPDWLWIWEGDLPNLANFMCDYVETAIARHRGRARRCLLATGCNIAGILGLGEDDLLWLTSRLAEAAAQIAPEMELIIGVAQPWAEYMARDEHTYTPLVFLDTLLRTGIKLAAIDLELALGFAPDGSYCRDLLDVSRLLDSFAVLSTPVEITLALASSEADDPRADPALAVGYGRWEGGFTPEHQASFGGDAASLALAKEYVSGVCWAHAGDGQPHRFPNAGLLDAVDQPKPILDKLRQIRQALLK